MRHVSVWTRVCVLLATFWLTTGCQQQTGVNLPDPSSESVEDTTGFPSVVEVLLPGGTGLCSGTFVSANAVLTASHCLKTAGVYTAEASFGEFTSSTIVQYGPGTVDDQNDIGFIIFSSPVADPTQGQVTQIGTSVAVGDVLELIGFGCDDLSTEAGVGVKRRGSNMVSSLVDFINFMTPDDSTGGDYQVKHSLVLGPINRAGSCFGDSGGPAATLNADGSLTEKGVTHAGGDNGTDTISEYIDLTRSDNHGWIAQMNSQYQLGISGF